MEGALLDTSFLITLSDNRRPNHSTARRYFTTCIDRGVTMYLSTIVVSEYEVKQRVIDLGLHNFIVLPFNIEDAISCASLTAPAFAAKPEGYPRATVKDDVKLLAQCEMSGITHFLTDDDKCVVHIETLRRTFPSRALPHGVACSAGFVESWFNPGNQGSVLGEDEES